MNFKKTAAMLSAACIVFSSLAGCGGSGNGGSGKAEIKSVSLPEKLDGSVIKILAYDGWEQEPCRHTQAIKGLVRSFGRVHRG